jgi:signal transduction histidine kinase
MTGPHLRNTAEVTSGTETRAALPSPAAGVPALLGVALACFLAQWLAFALWVPPANVSTVWVPGGLLLAIALLTERRRWPSVLTAGAVGVALLFGGLHLASPVGAIVLGIVTGLDTLAVALVLRRLIGPTLSLATRPEFLTYLAVVVVGGAIVVATMLLITVAVLRIRPATFQFWRTFALAVALAYLTVTPAVVLLVRRSGLVAAISPRRRVEVAVLALLLVLVSALVFSGTVDRLATWAVFATAFPPLLLWSALRFGALGASAALLLVAVVSTASTSRGMGPFTGFSPGDNTLSLQLFVLGIGVPLLGLAVVQTEEQRAREALQSSHAQMRELNRKLIAAREEEAARIARELHDDVGQRVALVSIGLGRLRQAAPESSAASPIVKLQEQTGAVARALRQISHQLHPAALEHAGLASALELICEEIGQATNLKVTLLHDDLADIPADVALGVYRVVQEALNNVIRHAGARQVNVLLRVQGPELALRVTDDGRGFDATPSGQTAGLGLRSAAERVAAVGGVLTVDSTAGGTTLRAIIPLAGGPHA